MATCESMAYGVLWLSQRNNGMYGRRIQRQQQHQRNAAVVTNAFRNRNSGSISNGEIK